MIREATLEDVIQIAQVHVDTWRTAYRGIVPDAHLAKLSYERRAEGWRQILQSAAEDGNFTLVVEQAGQIVGFANGAPERSGDPIYRGELTSIYILAAYQGQGLGRQLVRAVATGLGERGFNSMLVWVLAENPACRFYQALGGTRLRQAEREISGKCLLEVAYGWMDLTELRR